eukprot:TRINITY_DN108120_c0_g1_i1.p1 TRINITY_DN108120_c0_g1~~TRINITY_DN108120_c0_g1_i1.p1  ORF type:complete len:443 (-),score=48.25 TRINITY_DN108120_c0_g1_i1:139-1467(-)
MNLCDRPFEEHTASPRAEHVPPPRDTLLLQEIRGLREDLRQREQNIKSVPAGSEEVAKENKPGVVTSVSQDPVQKEIFFSILIRRLYGVNTVDQTFNARLHITLRWKMPDDEQPPEASADDGDWVPNWTPKFRISKLVDQGPKEEIYTLEIIDGERFVHGDILITVMISEQMELREFPHDCQELSIMLQLVCPASQARLVPSVDSPVCDLHEPEFLLADFELVRECPFVFELFDVTLRQSERNRFSVACVRIKLARKSGWYIINVAVVNMFLCSFVLCTWACHPADYDVRWSVDFTLVLTVVAYKLVLSGLLPTLSYLTFLDWYVFWGFVFLSLCIVSHSMLPLFFVAKTEYSPLTRPDDFVDAEEDLIAADLVSFWVLAGIWVAFNLVFIAVWRVRMRWEYTAFLEQALQQEKAAMSEEPPPHHDPIHHRRRQQKRATFRA